MPSPALETASKYLNNLLLARGLLQDGKPIDFACSAKTPTTDDDATDNTKSQTDATMSRIINIVHDLVLRRDRDAAQREAVVNTIRILRAEESQRILDFQRLQDKNMQLKDQLSTSEGQQRVLQSATRKTQHEVKELKEQVAKMKSTLDQVRAKCVGDVRKRDVEIEKLKQHISGMQRGRKESAAGGMKINTIHIAAAQKNGGREFRNGVEVSNETNVGLESETNGFLAALVNETSTENVALRKVVTESVQYLKNLTGMEEDSKKERGASELGDAIGIPGQYRNHFDDNASSHTGSLVPVQELAASVSQVLSHCRTILRDPSFVPIEEVQVRDAEIEKLRAGWEKMADRWKEAVTMMSQWRAKMAAEGHGHELDGRGPELQTTFEAQGLSGFSNVFNRSVAVRPNGEPVLDAIEEEELTSMLFDHGRNAAGNTSALSNPHDISQIHDSHLSEPDAQSTPHALHPYEHFLPVSMIQEQDEPESDLDLSEPRVTRPASSPARRGIQLPRPDMAKSQPLADTSSNPRKRKSEAEPDESRDHDSAIGSTEHHSSSMDPLAYDSDEDEIDDADLFLEIENIDPRKSKIPKLSVAQKLAVVEAEAGEATEVIRRRQATAATENRGSRRMASKSKTSGKAKQGALSRPGTTKIPLKDRDGEKDREKRKKTRDRRRSTLSPEELAELMGQ